LPSTGSAGVRSGRQASARISACSGCACVVRSPASRIASTSSATAAKAAAISSRCDSRQCGWPTAAIRAGRWDGSASGILPGAFLVTGMRPRASAGGMAAEGVERRRARRRHLPDRRGRGRRQADRPRRAADRDLDGDERPPAGGHVRPAPADAQRAPPRPRCAAEDGARAARAGRPERPPRARGPTRPTGVWSMPYGRAFFTMLEGLGARRRPEATNGAARSSCGPRGGGRARTWRSGRWVTPSR
jgi:hypothetical protein